MKDNIPPNTNVTPKKKPATYPVIESVANASPKEASPENTT
jgi:hypothetical protein